MSSGATPQRVVVEADGGSRGNPGPAAYGAVLRDADSGAVIAERSEAFGEATNNVAEYRGLIAGLEMAREHAPGAEVEVRLDSKLVIEQMAGRWKIKHPDLQPLAIKAQGLAPFGTEWTWVPRESPEDSTVQRHVQQWGEAGVFRRLWAVLIEHGEDLGGLDGEWQAADTALGKARTGGTRSGRTRPIVPRAA